MTKNNRMYGLTILTALVLSPLPVSAIPIVGSDYTVELYAQGIGAVTGLTSDGSGGLYAADYAGGRIMHVTGENTVDVYSSGHSYITDLALTDSGRLFASSSTGGSSNVLEIAGDGSTSIFSSGYSYPTSLESWGNDLFVSGSGDGVISKIASDGSSEVFLSGYGGPGGPFGISFDAVGNMYFVEHGSGVVYMSDVNGNVTHAGDVSGSGGTYTGIGFDDLLLVTDVNVGSLIQFDSLGVRTVFASNFEGKVSPPAIGPNDFVYDGVGNLFVGDGNYIWKISRITSVPEPASLALMGLGLVGLGFARRKKAA